MIDKVAYHNHSQNAHDHQKGSCTGSWGREGSGVGGVGKDYSKDYRTDFQQPWINHTGSNFNISVLQRSYVVLIYERIG